MRKNKMVEDVDFALTVWRFIQYDLETTKYNEAKARMLADKFETAISTPVRWATGIACPHPMVRKQIMDFIELQSRQP